VPDKTRKGIWRSW